MVSAGVQGDRIWQGGGEMVGSAEEALTEELLVVSLAWAVGGTFQPEQCLTGTGCSL